jgi:DNA-binding transcriptional ArsR family regulator
MKSRSELSLMEALHALADPVRLEIVRQLDEQARRNAERSESICRSPLSRTIFVYCLKVASSFQNLRGRSSSSGFGARISTPGFPAG